VKTVANQELHIITPSLVGMSNMWPAWPQHAGNQKF